jgi:hypothetical protein
MSIGPQKLSACPGCGVLLAELAGPVHAYMTSSPACWAVYGEVLAREYADPACRVLHRLTVDAYAVQHPGGQDPRAVKSVARHLLSLHAVFERGWSVEQATALLGRTVDLRDAVWLAPPRTVSAVTVDTVRRANSSAAHLLAVQAWAEAAWRDWADHHEQVRKWAASIIDA